MRAAVIDRRTAETQIQVRLRLDGKGRFANRSGIRFLDHMLDLVARHGGFDLEVTATGDLDVDQHHTVEDVGIALGGWALLVIGRMASLLLGAALSAATNLLMMDLALGAKQLFFKYCSTFDSTDEGNIGPVAEALMARLGTDLALAPQALPVGQLRDQRPYVADARGGLKIGEGVDAQLCLESRAHPGEVALEEVGILAVEATQSLGDDRRLRGHFKARRDRRRR